MPKDLFDIIKRKLAKNKLGSRSVKETYLLRNKVKCGYCGNPISAECGTARSGDVIRYYKCIGRKKYRNGCKKYPIRKDALENLVLDGVIQAMQDEKTIIVLIKGLMQIQEKANEERTTLKLLEKEKKQTQTALDNLIKAIERGIMSDSTNKRLHELETQIRDLDERIAVEQNKVAFTLSEDDIRRYYLSALKQEPQLLINCLVKEITLYDDKMIITFHCKKHGEKKKNNRKHIQHRKMCKERTVHAHKKGNRVNKHDPQTERKLKTCCGFNHREKYRRNNDERQKIRDNT